MHKTELETAVKVSGPSVEFAARDAILGKLPDTVTSVKINFSAGFPGDHIFLLGEDTAKALAALINKEENITLDEMALSVIGEAISQMVGTQITAITNKTGNKNIAPDSPEAVNIAKGAVAIPEGDSLLAAYDLDLGDGTPHKFWEIMGKAVVDGITQAISGAAAAAGGGSFAGASPSGMSPSALGANPNVQSVQFPGLNNTMSAREAGNIGLLMDVFMEMTVELGRTRKLIKEILSMGEGTIIELDKLAGEPVDILVNHVPIAKGEVVVIDENFGVRVTEIVSPSERMADMG